MLEYYMQPSTEAIPVEDWLLSTCSCHCTDKYSAFVEIAKNVALKFV